MTNEFSILNSLYLNSADHLIQKNFLKKMFNRYFSFLYHLSILPYWLNLLLCKFSLFFRCIHITDIGVGYISTMISLNALFLRWCSQIRDFGLQHLCSMRNLQVLSLAGCPLLTSSGLSSIIQLRHLQELELTNCAGASQELFSYLREHLPRCLIIE